MRHWPNFWQFLSILVPFCPDSKPSTENNQNTTRKDKPMGISMYTALVIFTNPFDLHITVGQPAEGAKFAFGIFRGPGHCFMRMLTSTPFAETLEDAIRAVKEILEAVCKAATTSLTDPECLMAWLLNPEGAEIDPSKVLNPELIERIIQDLRRHQVANTFGYDMLALPA